MRSLLFAILCFCFLSDAAAELRWKAVPLRSLAQKAAGLEGGEGFQQVMSIAYAPSNPNIVYFSTDTSGVWRSDDGGEKWAPRAIGFLPNGALSLSVDPLNPNIVLAAAYSAGLNRGRRNEKAAHGIYLTENGGITWKQVRKTWFSIGLGKGDLVTFAPSTTHDGRCMTAYAGSDEGLLKSVDGGKNWCITGFRPGVFFDLKVIPSSEGNLYLATEQGSFVFNGQTAFQIGAGLPGSVETLAVSMAEPKTVYAAVGKQGVYKSTDRGKTFRRASFGLPPFDFTDVAVSQMDANIVYARADRAGSGPFFSHDGAMSWHQPKDLNVDNLVINDKFWFSSPFATHPDIAKVALHSSNGRSCMLRTDDGGLTWRYSGNGFTGGRMKDMAFLGPGRMILALVDHGLWYSEDGGSTFVELNVQKALGRKSSNSVDAKGNVIVASVGRWGDKLIEVSQDMGKTWTVIQGTKGKYPFIGCHPQNPNVIYAGSYVSRDRGNHWGRMKHVVFGLFAGNGDWIYSISDDGRDGAYVITSKDGGQTWDSPYFKLPIQANHIHDIVVDPTDSDRIYVAHSNGILIYEKKVGWINRDDSNGLSLDAFGNCFVNCLAIDPKDVKIIYAGRLSPGYGRANGIFRSYDKGKTWQEANYNLSRGIGIYNISIDPYLGHVYVGSSLGTFRLSK